MSIRIQCDACGKAKKVNERLAGRTIRCPHCDAPLTIPDVVPTDAIVDAADDAGFTRRAGMDSLRSTLAVAVGSGAHANGDVAVVDNVRPSTATPSTATPATKPSILDDDDDALPPRKKREDGELDMTPMVDVTFLLLIFFMVTASFSLQKSIQMPKQTSDLPSVSNVPDETEELDPIELEIDENGGFLVMATDWERETPGKQNLITALKEAIGSNKDGMKLNIKIHENAKLQFLVDGMDAGTIAGFVELSVAEVDGFD